MFTLTIETNNAAFEDGRGYEIARILRDLADSVEEVGAEIYSARGVYDYNGNRVGSWELS